MTPKDLRTSALVALGMIAEGNPTAYAMKQAAERSTKYFFGLSFGAVYGDLRMLEERGLVEGRDEPHGRRQRRVYSLTDAGREALEAWLTADSEGVFSFQDELLARLYFADQIPTEETLAVVRRLRARCERELAELEAIEREADVGASCRRFPLELGIALTQTASSWAEQKERELTEPGAENPIGDRAQGAAVG
jgi:PadR family transcriptional regulator AphA